jgi:acetyl esterase/lipase
MADDTKRHPITMQPVVYRIPGMDAVIVRPDIEYADGRTIDLHYPPDAKRGERRPAVIFVTGSPDAGFQARLGCRQKEMASYVSWSRLVAVSGLVAVTYTNQNPADDVHTVLRYVRENAASLDLDGERIGIWSCSGNVPTALSLLMSETLTCAVLCYGFMLDLDGNTSVAEAQKQWGFANPSAGKSVDDIPRHLPLMIVRAGRDEFPGLNDAIDRFAAHALARNLPMTIVNHATGPHSFDLFDDSEASRGIIRQILMFLRFHLESA